MDCNKSDLPKDLSPKTGAAQKKLLNTKPKIDSPLLPKIRPDPKREKELSAKEQEIRRKFKEKINKLKKMPMPPQPTINVNSEGLTEESLPSATPEIEKTIEKKQSNAINVCVGTKPIQSAIYRFACVLPIKRNVAKASKKIESMICKSVGFLPEQYVNNNQFFLLSKDKQEKSVNSNTTTGNSDQIAMPPNENEKGNKKSTEKTVEKNKINPESTSPYLNLKSESSISVTSCKLTSTSTLPAAETSKATSSTSTDKSTSIIEQLNKSIAAAQLYATTTSNTTEAKTPEAATSNTMAAQTQEGTKSNITPSATLLAATAPAAAASAAALSAAQAPAAALSAAQASTATDAVKSTAEATSNDAAKLTAEATTTSTAAEASTTATTSTEAATSETTTTSLLKEFYSSPIHAHSDEQILLRKKIRKASEPTIDLAPDDDPKSKNVINTIEQPAKKLELVTKSKFPEPIKKVEPTKPPEIVEPIQTSPLISLLKVFHLDKIFKSFSGKSKEHKQKLIPISMINKIPIRLKQGFLVIGTFIPLYYTYHKIVTDNELTLKISEEN